MRGGNNMLVCISFLGEKQGCGTVYSWEILFKVSESKGWFFTQSGKKKVNGILSLFLSYASHFQINP